MTELVLQLLKHHVCGSPCSIVPPDEERAKELMRFAAAHGLSHVVAHALLAQGVPYRKPLDKAVVAAVYRCEQQNYEYAHLCTVFEEAQIPFIPLKGAVLRHLYPAEWMRVGCDIDILVQKDDLAHAQTILTETLSFQVKKIGLHDVSLYTPSGVHIELHFTLGGAHELSHVQQPLHRVWDYAVPVQEGAMQQALSDEMFYYYHLAHMAKHLLHGGCGIRPLLDLWLLEHHVSFDRAKREALLHEGGLTTFARHACHLAEVWFGDEAHSPTTRQLQDYIFGGGVYGSTQNAVAVQQAKNGGSGGFLRSRLWLSRDRLAYYYPVVDKHPILTPFCQARRWFSRLFGGKAGRGLRELNISRQLSTDKQTAVAQLLTTLELN